MVTLNLIRNNIQKDAENKLSVADMLQTIDVIDEFKAQHGYLPNDISEWYDMTLTWMKNNLTK